MTTQRCYSQISSLTPSRNVATSGSASSESWLEATWTSFLLWDIDREFQNAHEAYERWMTKNQPRRSTWECISGSNKEDALSRSLRLGSQVQKVIQEGQRKFGHKFDKGDATCHTILSAQLLRLQHEVCMPLLDTVHARYVCPIPHYDVLRAARGVRRTCLNALQDQIARFSTRKSEPYLPPPRFSVTFCPLALQLQKDQMTGNRSKIQAQKLHPQDRYDDREICPYCNVTISVAAHSGLTQSRLLLFQSHLLPQNQNSNERAAFACTGCYKPLDDSYAFLEHAFQKEIASEKSCLKRYSTQLNVSARLMDSDPKLVEQCLKNCLEREMTRSKGARKNKEVLKI